MRRCLAVSIAVIALAGPASAQQQCGQLTSSSLRNELALAAAFDVVDRLSCDVRDESPAPWAPIDRLDPRHGCTMTDVVLLQRKEQQLQGAAFDQICAAEAVGDCCATHESVGCSELAVSVCVCELEPRCCSGAWDAACAAIACSGACADVCVASDVPQPNAGLVEATLSPDCLTGMVLVPASAPFCVDRYEASLVQVPGDLPWSPYFNPGATAVRAVSLAGGVPQGYVDADQADAACQNSGKRLCSDTEWLRACRGASSRTYPYGSTHVDGTCNDTRAVHPLAEYIGLSAVFIYSRVGHPCVNQVPSGLSVGGAFPACVSVDGALDMVGNILEWTNASAGTLRGGYYVNSTVNGPGCLFATTAHDRSHRDYSTGFRCCADPL